MAKTPEEKAAAKAAKEQAEREAEAARIAKEQAEAAQQRPS